MNVAYCKCAFTESDGTFVPGEACEIHPEVVPQRTPAVHEMTPTQLLEWLLVDGDRCEGVVADAYAGWDTDVPWRDALMAEIEFQHRISRHANER